MKAEKQKFEKPRRAAKTVLEVRQLWGEEVLDIKCFSPADRQVVVGEGRGVDFFAPRDMLSGGNQTIAKFSGKTVVLSFGPRAAGELVFKDGRRSALDALPGGEDPAGTPGCGCCRALSLPAGSTATIRLGKIGFRFNYRRRPRGYLGRLSDRLDYTLLHTVLLVLFVYAGLVATVHLRPKASTRSEDELHRVPDRYAAYFLNRAEDQKKDLVFRDRLDTDLQGKVFEKFPGKEGKAGKPGMPDTGRRFAVKAIKPDDREVVGTRGLLALFGAGGPQGLSLVQGGTGLGGELEGAIGNLDGDTVGDSGGWWGLGRKGTGPGGGGLKPISIGSKLRRNRWVVMKDTEYGKIKKLPQRGEKDVVIGVGRLVVVGTLSMELVREVIHSHRDQIRYCYTRELTRHPQLAGKVAVSFTIALDGYVSRASISKSTLGNAEVEHCILDKVRTWKFPAPRGGVVMVNYPFLLKSS